MEKVKFKILTLASIHNSENYPIQEDEVLRVTKTLVITKTGLRFKRRDGFLQKGKTNKKALREYLAKVNFYSIFGATSVLTKEYIDKYKN